MENRPEETIKKIYKSWMRDQPKAQENHIGEEDIALLCDNKASRSSKNKIFEHILSCGECANKVAHSARLKTIEMLDVPLEVTQKAKDLLDDQSGQGILKIALKLKEGFLEIVSATGSVLVGQELMPVSVLRGRGFNASNDKITVVKVFPRAQVEINVLSGATGKFNIQVDVKKKNTPLKIKDLRITLLKHGIELESYHTDSGKAVFEQVSPGQYHIEISSVKYNLASVLLNVTD